MYDLRIKGKRSKCTLSNEIITIGSDASKFYSPDTIHELITHEEIHLAIANLDIDEAFFIAASLDRIDLTLSTILYPCKHLDCEVLTCPKFKAVEKQ